MRGRRFAQDASGLEVRSPARSWTSPAVRAHLHLRLRSDLVAQPEVVAMFGPAEMGDEDEDDD